MSTTPKQKYTTYTHYHGNGSMTKGCIGQWVYLVQFNKFNQRYEASFQQTSSYVIQQIPERCVFDEKKLALKECYKRNRKLIEAAIAYEANLRDGDITHFF